MMTLESGLEEGQVLQRRGSRGAETCLSGSCPESGPILATISDPNGILKGWRARRVGKSANGRYSVKVKGIPAGGPYRLKLQAGKQEVIRSLFFVGDVWLMAGQSNMEGCGDMTSPAQPHPLIRTFSMRREWRLATDPLHLRAESPDLCHSNHQCSPEQGEIERRHAKKGAGVGIFFAREMLEHSGVPQGLIATAHGGTSLSQWSPELKAQGGNSLYGSMLLSLRATGQPVAGVLWYQGENETSPAEAPFYTKRMRKLVAAVRRDLQLPRLPWMIVQLSRVYWNNHGVSWNSIQEQQRLLPGKIDRLETVAAIDLPLDDGVHIGAAGFPRLGLRLAYAARQFVAGGKKRPPQLRAIRPVRDAKTASSPCIEVIYDSIEGDLRSEGSAQGFTLVSSEGKPVPIIYKTTLHGNIVRLHCSTNLTPDLSLHYGWGLAPVCNITDSRDFSLPVFGPLPLFKPAAYLPFVTVWKTSGIVTTDQPLGKISCPAMDVFKAAPKTYGAVGGLKGFINERQLWQGQSGQAYFTSTIQIDEPMKVLFLMGYDGPFRLWLDGKLHFEDLAGTNPCFADQSEKRIALSSGPHRITVGMDLDGGKAWGFFLRFIRTDVSARRIASGDYAGWRMSDQLAE